MTTYRKIPSRRRPLIKGQTAVYHIISRTTCDQFLFKDREKEMFRRMLHNLAAFHGVEVLTYCVMSNHFHLLLRIPFESFVPDSVLIDRYRSRYSGPHLPPSAPAPEVVEAILDRGGPDADDLRERLLSRMGNLPEFVRELKQAFCIWYNRTHQNHGTIWAERYKSLIVEDATEALTAVAAYIDLNPVRAEIVDDPAEYRWCGYAEAVGGSQVAQKGLSSLYFGPSRSWRCAISAYRVILFGKGRKAKGQPGKDGGRISAESAKVGQMGASEMLRNRVRYFSDGMVLGSKEFLECYFDANRQQFGPRRQSGARQMRGADWGALHVMRDLKNGVKHNS